MHRQQNLESQPWGLVHEDSERPILIEHVSWTIWSMRISSRGAFKKGQEGRKQVWTFLISRWRARIWTSMPNKNSNLGRSSRGRVGFWFNVLSSQNLLLVSSFIFPNSCPFPNNSTNLKYGFFNKINYWFFSWIK